jgi:D-3-phosphoglycerate dehydrogenase
LTFYTDGAMDRLETETLERCFEILEGKDVLVKSLDPRLLKQRSSIIFND